MSIDYQKLILTTSDNEFEVQMKAYNIAKKTLDDSIEQVVSWFNMQPHYPNLSKDDLRIKRFLAANSFSTEETKRVLENLFTSRSLIPEIFVERNMKHQNIKDILTVLDIVLLPKLTPSSARLSCLRLKTTDATHLDLNNYIRLLSIVEDFRRLYDCTMDTVTIEDYSNATTNHLMKITPSLAKKVNFIFKECYGGKLKGINLINLPSFAHTILLFSKSLMSKKVAQRVHVHQTFDTLYEVIPKDCLPIDFGGTCGSIQEHRDNLLRCLESDEMYNLFKNYENEKSDESKRPESSKKNSDFSSLGMEGSFRNLDFD